MFNNFNPRILIASTLVLGVAAVFPSAAFAGTTADVPLSGTVNSTLALTSTPTSGAGLADNLALDNLAANSQQTVKVSTLGISTNSEQGYTLTVSSTSATLTDNDGVGTPIAYTAGVSTNASAPSTFVSPAGVGFTHATSAANAVNTNDRYLYIQYTPAALQDPGTYTGTINLSVADN